MSPTTRVIQTITTFVTPASRANHSYLGKYLGKSVRFGLGLAAFICAVYFTSWCETSKAASPLIARVQNNHLVDANGNFLRLFGVDRSGSEYMCVAAAGVFDGPVDAAAIAAIAAWRVNAVRVPLNEDCWLGINLPASNPYIGVAYQQAIVGFVQALNNAGMYVILDLHWNAPGTSIANQQQPMADLDHSPTFWSSVATTFKEFPGVIFDLYNEPYVSSWGCWQNGCSVSTSDGTWLTAGMTQLVNVVRATGATQPIMLGGLSYASDLSQWLAYAPVDPIKGPAQLVASYHSYCGPPGTSTVAACQAALNSIEAGEWPVVSGVAKSVPVVTGEFGEYDCATTYVTPYMAFADANGISYLGWAWNPYDCGSFPALISGYTGTPTNYGIGLKSHLRALSARHDTHDFNGDDHSDIAWVDTSGNLAVWLMHGATVLSSGGLGTVPTTWTIVGQRDFNGDGNADLLWRDTAGNTSIWFISGIQVSSSASVGNIPITWSVAGTGDFNGDRMGDLLWRDTSGNTTIWLMNGATVTSSGGLGNIPATWSVVGTGDYNGDGKADLLWRDTSGDTAIWFMNGTTVLSSASLGNIPTTWSVVGTGDFNGDGYSDILWQDSSGNTSMWLMNGGTVLSSAGLGNVPTTSSVVLTGDYDGDGKSDLLWRDTSGNTSIWFMNGTTISSTGSLGNIPTTWTVQSTNAE
jgi:Cellulase (glycosyl hydrolase family 5)/FG-GAP-like repeat